MRLNFRKDAVDIYMSKGKWYTEKSGVKSLKAYSINSINNDPNDVLAIRDVNRYELLSRFPDTVVNQIRKPFYYIPSYMKDRLIEKSEDTEPQSLREYSVRGIYSDKSDRFHVKTVSTRILSSYFPEEIIDLLRPPNRLIEMLMEQDYEALYSPNSVSDDTRV